MTILIPNKDYPQNQGLRLKFYYNVQREHMKLIMESLIRSTTRYLEAHIYNVVIIINKKKLTTLAVQKIAIKI